MTEQAPLPADAALGLLTAARPGARLAAARVALGLSAVDVARQLRLSPAQIEALEADDYTRLPGAVFVRGFVRNYARLVKIDPAELISQTVHPLPVTAHVAPNVPPAVGAAFDPRRPLIWPRYAAIAAVVVLPVALYAMLSEEPNGGIVATRIQPNVETTALPLTREAATVPVTELPPAPAAEKAAAAAPKAGEHLLRFTFIEESWVEVRDRNGHNLFSQLNPAGGRATVSGMPPLSLVVGNARGVRLQFDGQPVDLEPHIKVDVARLTLE